MQSRGVTLDRMSVMGTSDPLTYFKMMSYFRGLMRGLCNLGGLRVSFFLKLDSRGLV